MNDNQFKPLTGEENTPQHRANYVAIQAAKLSAATKMLADAASEAAREVEKLARRDRDAEARLEEVQAAFWYCAANKFDRATLRVWADSLGIAQDTWTNPNWVALEIQKREIPLSLSPAIETDG